MSKKDAKSGHPALPVTGTEQPQPFTRREMMRRVVTTAAGAALTIGGGAVLLGRDTAGENETLATIADHRVERAMGAVDLAIAHGSDPALLVRKAIAAMGGIESFVRPGDKVLIKPNVGWNRLPAQAANTNPAIVSEVVRQVVAASAAKVWVTDVPVNSPERCFARSGVGPAAEEAGARVILPTENAFRTVAVGGELLRVGDVLWPFVEADKVINLPVVKQHGLCHATMSMKNWYGVLGGHRVRLHQDIDRSIMELAMMAKPTLTVLDATRVLMANGPSGGSLDDVKRFDSLAVGVDEVALDAWGAAFLDRRPDELGFVTLADRAGLGRADWRSLKVEEVQGG